MIRNEEEEREILNKIKRKKDALEQVFKEKFKESSTSENVNLLKNCENKGEIAKETEKNKEKDAYKKEKETNSHHLSKIVFSPTFKTPQTEF